MGVDPDNYLRAALRPDGSIALLSSSVTGLWLTFDSGTTFQRIATNSSTYFGGGPLVPLPDNKLLLAGGSYDAISVTRFNADGSRDPTFGTGGTANVELDPNHPGRLADQSSLNGLAALPDGSIYAAGGFRGHLTLFRFEGGDRTPATKPPSAARLQFNPFDIRNGSTLPFIFDIIFVGSQPLRESTVDNSDVVVTGPNNYTASATFVGSGPPSSTGDRTPFLATYSVTPPGGSWDATDDGIYTVHLRKNQVFDISGQPAPAKVVGGFKINL